MHPCARLLFRCLAAPLFVLIFCALPARAALTATPNSIDFGSQPIDGTPQTTIVTLNNNTSRTFSIVSISDSTPEFSLSTQPLPVTLPPGGTLTVNITFTPDTAANFTGSLGFTTSHGWRVNVPLSGSGQDSAVPGSGGRGNLSNYGQLSFNPVIAFGAPDASGYSAQTFMLTNSGNNPVTISSVTWTGPTLTFSALYAGAVISPGQSLAVAAWYAPQAASSGTLTISSDAANSPAVVFWTASTSQSSATAVSTASAASTAASTAMSSTDTAPFSGGTSSAPESVNLTWSPSTSEGVVGYNVYRGSVAGGPYNPITSGPVASTAYSDNTVASAQTFYYVVTALESGGQESGFSGEVAVAIP